MAAMSELGLPSMARPWWVLQTFRGCASVVYTIRASLHTLIFYVPHPSCWRPNYCRKGAQYSAFLCLSLARDLPLCLMSRRNSIWNECYPGFGCSLKLELEQFDVPTAKLNLQLHPDSHLIGRCKMELSKGNTFVATFVFCFSASSFLYVTVAIFLELNPILLPFISFLVVLALI